MKRLIISALVLGTAAAGSLAKYGARATSRKATRKIIQLAEPKLRGPMSLEEALAKRRSVREYAARSIGFPLPSKGPAPSMDCLGYRPPGGTASPI